MPTKLEQIGRSITSQNKKVPRFEAQETMSIDTFYTSL
jgi:hypothetical protein